MKYLFLLLIPFCSLSQTQKYDYNWHFEKGMSFFRDSNYVQAQYYLETAFRMKSDSVKPIYYKGISDYRRGQFTYAIKDFSKALLLDSNLVDCYLYRAASYFSTSSINGSDILALSDINKHILKAGKNKKNLLTRASINSRLQNNNQAVLDIREALNLGIDSTEKYKYLGFLAENEMIIKDYKGAIETYTKMIAVEPNGENYYLRGIARLLIKDSDACIDIHNSNIMRYLYAESKLITDCLEWEKHFKESTTGKKINGETFYINRFGTKYILKDGQIVLRPK